MRKLVIFLTLTFLFFIFGKFSLAFAYAKEEGFWYTPRKGETPSGIAKKFGINWQEILHFNKISSPKKLQAGKKIFIAVIADGNKANNSSQSFFLEKLGTSPLNPNFQKKYSWLKVGKIFGLSVSEREELKNLFQEAENLENISQRRTEVIFVSKQKSPRWKKMLFRKGNKENIVPSWEGEEVGIRINLSSGRSFEFLRKCGNIGELISEEKETPLPSSTNPYPSFSSKEEEKKEEEKKERIRREKLDFYSGTGRYQSFEKEYSKGWYQWNQLGIYPLGSFYPAENLEILPGIMAWYGLGKGQSQGYDYRWDELILGPVFKVFGKGWDADLHFGLSHMKNKGGEGKYSSSQRDWSYFPRVHYNNYSREDEGKDWFPRWEGDLTARFPFETTHRNWWDGERLKNNPTDQTRLTAEVKPWVKRFYLDEHQQISMLVGGKFGIEHLFAKGSYQNLFLGPNFRLDLLGKEIFEISPFSPQFSTLTNNWSWSVGGWIYPQGILKWWKAKGVKEIKKGEDRKDLLLDYEDLSKEILRK